MNLKEHIRGIPSDTNIRSSMCTGYYRSNDDEAGYRSKLG